jgi:hypothetical protein
MPLDPRIDLLEKFLRDSDRKREECHREILEKMEAHEEKFDHEIEKTRVEFRADVKEIKDEISKTKNAYEDSHRFVSSVKKVSGLVGVSAITSLCAWIFATVNGWFGKNGQ